MNHDAPYDRLPALPRTLWLPAVITAVGVPTQRLHDVQRWRQALDAGGLPPADATFGDPQATAPLRQACAELGLPSLCPGAPAMTEQVLRTLLWHLDRLIDLQPRLDRAQAIAEATREFRSAWNEEKGDWDSLLSLLQGLGDLAHLRWDELRGLLRSREWAEAERISQALARLPELQALLRRLGRAERAARPQALPPQPLDGGARRLLGQRVVETRLPGLPGE